MSLHCGPTRYIRLHGGSRHFAPFVVQTLRTPTSVWGTLCSELARGRQQRSSTIGYTRPSSPGRSPLSSETPAIVVAELRKIYEVPEREAGLAASPRSLVRRRVREVRAVDGVSLTIAPGEIVGFLGPNGAGIGACLSVGSREPKRLVKSDGFVEVAARETRIHAFMCHQLPLFWLCGADLTSRDYTAHVARHAIYKGWS